jgi:hypothetical protein
MEELVESWQAAFSCLSIFLETKFSYKIEVTFVLRFVEEEVRGVSARLRAPATGEIENFSLRDSLFYSFYSDLYFGFQVVL